MTFITKNEARRIAREMGCTARYSGEARTMYISGVRADEAVKAIWAKAAGGEFAVTRDNITPP